MPPDELPTAEQPVVDEPLLTAWLAAASPMTLGKAMAQAGHAGMIAVALLSADGRPVLDAWAAGGCPAVAHRATGEQWAALSAEVAQQDRAWQDGRCWPSGTPVSPRSIRGPSR